MANKHVTLFLSSTCQKVQDFKQDHRQTLVKQNCLAFISCYMWCFGLMSRVFTNGPGDWDSIPGRVVPKTQKMVFDTVLLNTQQVKVRIKGKVKQSREWSSTLSYTSVWQLLKREPSDHPRLKVADFTLLYSQSLCVCVCVLRGFHCKVSDKSLFKQNLFNFPFPPCSFFMKLSQTHAFQLDLLKKTKQEVR